LFESKQGIRYESEFVSFYLKQTLFFIPPADLPFPWRLGASVLQQLIFACDMSA
jgi:hypothetical protein